MINIASTVLLIVALTVAAASVAATPPPPAPPVSPEPSGPRVNVRDYGTKADGVTDDTAAIRAAIAAAPNGATIYFPTGTYVLDSLEVKSRTGLRFEGDGFASILKRPPRLGNTRIATFVSTTNITIANLAFDENGIQNYGGVNFFGVRQVTIEHTRHFDSNPAPLPHNRTDRYSYVFGRGSVPSEDIVIRHNIIDDLQLEVDLARRVTISDNTVSRACCTAGIGGFTLADGAIMEDYTIERNVIIDPRGSSIGIVMDLDPPSTNNATIRRIRIANNTIIRRTTNGNGVLIGTPNNSVSTRGNVFEDIAIVGNRFQVEPGAPSLRENGAAIKANNRPTTANLHFDRFVITGNVMTRVGYGMDLRFVLNSTISGNDLRGVSPGIALADKMRGNTIVDNLVESSGLSYYMASSGGGNTFERNRYTGRTTNPLRTQDVAGSDVIVPPTYDPNPPPQR